MKKSFKKMPYPIIVICIVIMVLVGFLYLRDIIEIVLLLVIYIFLLFVITFKKTLYISEDKNELIIIQTILFIKINIIKIAPERIMIIKKWVKRNRISAKSPTGNLIIESSDNLQIFEKNRDKPVYVIMGSEGIINEIGELIHEELKINIEKKSIQIDRQGVFDLNEITQKTKK
jgi:hypothetical protein